MIYVIYVGQFWYNKSNPGEFRQDILGNYEWTGSQKLGSQICRKTAAWHDAAF